MCDTWDGKVLEADELQGGWAVNGAANAAKHHNFFLGDPKLLRRYGLSYTAQLNIEQDATQMRLKHAKSNNER